jgi:drug/metabolite transporter (DMT)-like permease
MVYFLIMLMVLSWSFNFIVAKWVLRELPPFALLFLRVLFSNLILLGIYFGTGQHKRRRIQPGDWRWFALLGFFGIALNQTGFTVGINYTTVPHSSLIIATTPLYVLLLAVRMKQEALTWQKLFGILLSFSGVVILTLEHGLGGDSPTFLGDIITLGGAVAFALYAVYSKHVTERYDTLTMITFIYLTALVVVTPLAGWELFEVDWSGVTWRGWLGTLYIAAIASVAAYSIFYYALKKISATRVIVFTYMQPVLATILSILLLSEQLTPYLVGGGSLVLVGVYLAELGRG